MKKLVLKESMINNLIDINLLCVFVIIFSKGTILLPAYIVCVINALVLIVYGTLNYEK